MNQHLISPQANNQLFVPQQNRVRRKRPSKYECSMSSRNAKERARIKMVNDAFVALGHHIPGQFQHRKMTKLNILWSAVQYIQHLQQEKHEDGEFSQVGIEQPTTQDQTLQNGSHFGVNQQYDMDQSSQSQDAVFDISALLDQFSVIDQNQCCVEQPRIDPNELLDLDFDWLIQSD